MSATLPNLGVDPARTWVILLGAETFPLMDSERASKKLPPLSKEAFKNSVREFEQYFCDPHPSGFGIPNPSSQIIRLFDSDSIGPAQINDIRKLLSAATPLPTDLIVYYVGHGQPKASGYYLCVKHTESDALDTTAIKSQELVRVLGQTIERSGNKLRVYLFFDACFSAFPFEGQAVDEPDDHHLKALPQQGMAALCSSGKDELSITPKGWQLTLYTRSLLETLREQNAKPSFNERERLSLNHLRDRMWERIPSLYPSDPVKPRIFNPKQDHGLVAEVGLFPNPRHSPAPAAPARRLLEEVKEWWANEGPSVALRRLEGRISAAKADELAEVAGWFGEEKIPSGAVVLFAGLSHPHVDVANASVAAIKEIGWEGLTKAVTERMERENNAETARIILAGSRVYPADERLVRFLRKVSRFFPSKLAPIIGDLIELKEYRLRDDTFKAEFNQRNSQYRIEKAIGLGPITISYLGVDRTSREAVVVRALKNDYARQPAVTAAFLQLAQMARSSGNQYSLRVFTFSPPEEEAVYLVRSFSEGCTLREEYANGTRLTPLDVVVLLRNLAEAIRPFHEQGKCQGGIRPANIFITSRHPFYLLGDPSPFLPTEDNPSGTIVGPPDRQTDDARYTAPEAFFDPPSRAADLYSLGCVGFFVLCGRPPYESKSRNKLMLDHLNASIPIPSDFGSTAGPTADAIILQLMAKNPEHRYQEIDDLLDDLKTLRKELSASSGSSTSPSNDPPASPATPAVPTSNIPPSDTPNQHPSKTGDENEPQESTTPIPESNPEQNSFKGNDEEFTPPPSEVSSDVTPCPPEKPALPVPPLAPPPLDQNVVLRLLNHWSMARHQGLTLSPEDLAPNDPILREELRRRLQPRQASKPQPEESEAPSTGDFTIAPANSGRAFEQPMVSIVEQTYFPETHPGLPEPPEPVKPTQEQEFPKIQNYEISRVLGRGGMGVVYLAHNRLMDRQEVLKVVNAQMMSRVDSRDRFMREAQSAARLNHPNVVIPYSVIPLGDTIVLSMEYVEGEDLSRIVRDKGPLPVGQACEIIFQVANGLQHAFEKGMVHRDIKPANLILTSQGDRRIVKILDFGLAKAVHAPRDTGLTADGQLLGTPDFLSPEQIQDAARADIRADIYSLGCTFYYLLAGKAPFFANNVPLVLVGHLNQIATPLNQVRPDVPASLADLVAKMMAKSPQDRFQSPKEVAHALRSLIQDLRAGNRGLLPLPSTLSPSNPSVLHNSSISLPRVTLPTAPAPSRRSLPSPGAEASPKSGRPMGLFLVIGLLFLLILLGMSVYLFR